MNATVPLTLTRSGRASLGEHEAPPRSGGLLQYCTRWRKRSDLLCLTAVVGAALVVRGQLLFRAPMFMQHDSLGYFLPAYELFSGEGFGIGFRRTPVYPLFLAGVLTVFGESLDGLLIVQHALGAVTAALTYCLGRITFGRIAGLLAGLLVAVNGALVIGEHYLMSEAVFIPLLMLALLVSLLAFRDRNPWMYVASGLLLGAAALCRPIAQALFPLIALGLLILGHNLRTVVQGSLLTGIGIAAMMLPWAARSCVTSGECSTTGVMGQAMLARTAYYDHGFVFYDPSDPARGPDAPRPAIRRSIQRASDQNASGGVIARRLQAEFRWTDAETARYTREMALEVIRRQPVYYVTGTFQMFWQIFRGEFDRLRTDWKTQARRLNRDQWDERLTHLLANPTPQQEAEFDRADAAVSFWQPAYWRPWLPLLSIIGLVVASLKAGPARGATILGLSSLVLMLVAAALDGPVPRYRYPADPLIAVMAAGGALGILRLAASAIERLKSQDGREGSRLRLGHGI